MCSSLGRNPAFYATVFSDESDQPAREGPHAAGMVELVWFKRPLSAKDAATIDSGIRMIPALLDQARVNLTGNQKDIWNYGTRAFKEQSAVLAAFGTELAAEHTTLKDDVAKAKTATDAFAQWLDSRAASKTGPSGIGVENYNWYLENVQLLPYTWHDLVEIMELELARAWAFLALEETRNAAVPPLKIVSSADEHGRRFNAAITDYVAYIRDHELLTMKPYMDRRLRERIGSYSDRRREFFTEVDYRDPMVMRTHGFHWFDKGQMAEEPHARPIRRVAPLYNIFNTRTEGFATEWEEMMMGAGMFDRSPHSRELIYILVAERAARALGDLKMQKRASPSLEPSWRRRTLRADGSTSRVTPCEANNVLSATARLRYRLRHRQSRGVVRLQWGATVSPPGSLFGNSWTDFWPPGRSPSRWCAGKSRAS